MRSGTFPLRILATVVLLDGLALPVPAASPARAASAPPSFVFAAAGDFGANARTSSTFSTLAGAGTDVFFALGDLSYSEVTPESAWCDFVTSRVGATYPFELLSGNHENSGVDGSIANFAACLPDRLGNVAGSYAKEYYADYPPSQPLARFVMISPHLAFPGQPRYDYTVGSAHYQWLSDAVDGARANGIRWVIVGMHENCISIGVKPCDIGPDLLNLLVAKKVDLILQGHEHAYERSKQLALDPATCPGVAVGSYDADCVVDDGSDGNYTQGSGPVVVISGTGGVGLRTVNTGDPEAGYFTTLMGSDANPTFGFVKYTVTPTQITAQFVRSAGGTFSDAFTIAAPAGNHAPNALAGAASTPQDTPVTVTLRGRDDETCDLTFSIVSQPAHGTVSTVPSDQACVSGIPNTDTATVTYTPASAFNGTDSFAFRVNDGTTDSNPATVTITVGTPTGVTLRAATSAQNPTATTLTIPVPAGVAGNDVLVAAVGVRGSAAVTAPVGWTLIRTDVAGTYTKQALFYRVAGTAEPPSYTWSFSTSVPAAGGIFAYQRVNTTTPINASAGIGTNANTASILAPSITTTVTGAAVVGFFSIGGNNSITPPPGMTERGEADSTAGSSHVTWEGSDFTPPAAGATGPKTAQGTIPHPNTGALVALTPA